MYPEDPRAPFYDPSGKEMKPVARLYLNRIEVIPKSCSEKSVDDLLEEVHETDNTEDSARRKSFKFPLLHHPLSWSFQLQR